MSAAAPAPDVGSFYKRIECWKQTQQESKMIQNPPPSYKHHYDASRKLLQRFQDTSLSLFSADALDCGLRLKGEGLNPAVLNPCNHSLPGGMVSNGSLGQEESIFRRTNICRTLIMCPELYPIQYGEGIYSPSVCILKADEAEGWVRYNFTDMIDIISSSGLHYHTVNAAGQLCQEDEEKLAGQLRTVIQIACLRGHDSLVLGALGCSASSCRNPVEQIATIFKRVLVEHVGVLKQIIIAIPPDFSNSSNNFSKTNDNFIGRTCPVYAAFKATLFPRWSLPPGPHPQLPEDQEQNQES